MSVKTHEAHVAEQFGPQAAAYVASAVHASGDDLAQLVEIVRGQADARVLDLGCGGGHVSFNVAPQVGEVTAYDLSAEMLAAVAAEAARRGLSNVVTRRGPAETLPFEDASFDFVLSRYTAHHWRDFPAGLREARRVLKPDGRAVFIDAVAPADPLLDTFLQALELLRDPSHVRDYSVEEWKAAASRAGFAPTHEVLRRVRLDFASWIARMRTPAPHVEAIRSLQQRMPEAVSRHFAFEPDGTFTIDAMTLEAFPV